MCGDNSYGQLGQPADGAQLGDTLYSELGSTTNSSSSPTLGGAEILAASPSVAAPTRSPDAPLLAPTTLSGSAAAVGLRVSADGALRVTSAGLSPVSATRVGGAAKGCDEPRGVMLPQRVRGLACGAWHTVLLLSEVSGIVSEETSEGGSERMGLVPAAMLHETGTPPAGAFVEQDAVEPLIGLVAGHSSVHGGAVEGVRAQDAHEVLDDDQWPESELGPLGVAPKPID